MTGKVAVDQHGYTRNIAGTTDPAGSFATSRQNEPAAGLTARVTPATPLPSALWSQLGRDEWRANAKRLQITMAAYKSRFESSFRRLEGYEAENGTWQEPVVPAFFTEDLEALVGVPVSNFPTRSWEDLRPEVIRQNDGRPAVKIICDVGFDDRCDDSYCDHNDCPETVIEALRVCPGFITLGGDQYTRPHVLFGFADPARTLLAEEYLAVNTLAQAAKYRNGIAESVAAGGPFWFR